MVSTRDADSTPNTCCDWTALRAAMTCCAPSPWSSSVSTVTLRPLIPPASFCAWKRALAASRKPAKVVADGPVSGSMTATLTSFAVTPGDEQPDDELADDTALVPHAVRPGTTRAAAVVARSSRLRTGLARKSDEGTRMELSSHKQGRVAAARAMCGYRVGRRSGINEWGVPVNTAETRTVKRTVSAM